MESTTNIGYRPSGKRAVNRPRRADPFTALSAASLTERVS
jgi:hypothetical protein